MNHIPEISLASKLFILFLPLLITPSVDAFEEDESATVSARDAISITLEQNPFIILAGKDVQLSEADLEFAKGEFDWHLNSQVNSEFVEEDSSSFTTSDQVSAGASIGLTRKLRNGTVVGPNINAALIDNENNSDSPIG